MATRRLLALVVVVGLGLAGTGCSSSPGSADGPSPTTASGSSTTAPVRPVSMTYPTNADIAALVQPTPAYLSSDGSTDCAGSVAADSVCRWETLDNLEVQNVNVSCRFYGPTGDATVDRVRQTFARSVIAETVAKGRTAAEIGGMGTPAVLGTSDPRGYFISAFVPSGDTPKACTYSLFAPYDANSGVYGAQDRAVATTLLTALVKRSLGR